MEVVYLFYEFATVRIPFFGCDWYRFSLLVKRAGGIRDNARKEFVFGQNVSPEQFGRIFSGIPCVQVEESSSVPLRIFGFWERPWEESAAVHPERQNGKNSYNIIQRKRSAIQ